MMLAHLDASSYSVTLSLRARSLAHRPPARHRRAAALAMVVFSTLLAACGTTGTKTSPPASASIKSAAEITVVIKNYGFVPTNLTVPPGTTVTVRNEDQAIHTLTADNRAFNTGNVSRGLPTTFTAPAQRGTYPYHCLFHNYMSGALTVS